MAILEVKHSLIDKAAAYAEKAHEGQVRKYTDLPYFVHPQRVALAVSAYTDRPEVIAAAYLHDVLEDCGQVCLKDIYEEFGVKVSDLVIELTNPSKKFPTLKRAARKEMDRLYLNTCSANAQLIKVIDRLDNIRDMEGAPDDFKSLYFDETILLAQTLTKAPAGLVEELMRACIVKPEKVKVKRS